MFTTIVWATDGSEDAARALPYAKALATGEGAMLVAVHIVQERAGLDTDAGLAADAQHQGDGNRVRELCRISPGKV